MRRVAPKKRSQRLERTGELHVTRMSCRNREPARQRCRRRSRRLATSILILGLLLFRMPFDEVAGIVPGACGNPAILAYSNKLTPTDRPDIGYAMIFAGMTIVKILFVDIVPAFF